MEQPPAIYQLRKIYPLPEGLLEELLEFQEIFFFEEAEAAGSISEHLEAALCARGWKGRFEAVTLPSAFIPQGRVPDLLAEYGLDQESIRRRLQEE